jgi:isopentenyl diphosphate isomerase/L-lactate dehydrogenase-like FMN-dependent dehydrogenase
MRVAMTLTSVKNVAEITGDLLVRDLNTACS